MRAYRNHAQGVWELSVGSYLFTFFYGCAGSLFATHGLSLVAEWGLPSSCGLLIAVTSRCRTRALGQEDFHSISLQSLVGRLSSCGTGA